MTSNAVKEAAQQAIAAAKGEEKAEISLTPGTYTATQNGYQRRHVTVSVTVDEKSITDVQIVECTDNPITVTKTALRADPGSDCCQSDLQCRRCNRRDDHQQCD